jgi:hypothetical protein
VFRTFVTCPFGAEASVADPLLAPCCGWAISSGRERKIHQFFSHISTAKWEWLNCGFLRVCCATAFSSDSPPPYHSISTQWPTHSILTILPRPL